MAEDKDFRKRDRGETDTEWVEAHKELLLEHRTVWRVPQSRFTEGKEGYDDCEYFTFLEKKRLEDGEVRYTWELDESVRLELDNLSVGHFADVIVHPDPPPPISREEPPKKTMW